MKHFTFQVVGSFTMQRSFQEDELHHGEPTEKAITDLREALLASLSQNFSIEVLEVELDELLGETVSAQHAGDSGE